MTDSARGEILNNRYKLLAEQIGSGGMAYVYRAEDLALGRTVAVKVLRENLTTDPEFIARFQREARAAANLSHPNIVTVYDVGQDHGRYYIVMEYVEGPTLKELIKAEAPFDIERALDLAIQICAGVGYAHRSGIIHCDVKPQNVLVTADGRAKVTDFGIARALSSATVPLADAVWGTPHYAAPEQALGKPPTPAADVYAIGIILYEMLSGRLPFEADSYTALALKHVNEEPPPLSQFNPRVPDQLEHIVHKVLAKEPSARYRTAEQLGRILINYRRERLEPTGPHTPLRPVDGALATGIGDHKLVAGPRPPAPGARRPTSVARVQPKPLEDEGEREEEEESATDWVGILLATLALIAVLGLFPLWAIVYRVYTTRPVPIQPVPGFSQVVTPAVQAPCASLRAGSLSSTDPQAEGAPVVWYATLPTGQIPRDLV